MNLPLATRSVADAIRSRRAVRRFRDEPLPDAHLHELADLALEAPSSWNHQARSVVVVADPTQRRELAAATGGQRQPLEAPATLVFVAECQAWRSDLTDVYEAARRSGAWSEEFIAGSAESSARFQQDLAARGLLREYAVKDAMIAASFAMVAASGMGLATAPMGGWDEQAVKEVIGAAGRDDLAVALLLAVGFPAEERRHPGRRPRERHLFHGRYGAAAPAAAVPV